MGLDFKGLGLGWPSGSALRFYRGVGRDYRDALEDCKASR